MNEITEQAYVVVGDLNRCKAIKDLLGDIVSKTNDNIADDEYTDVVVILSKWIARGYESLDVRP